MTRPADSSFTDTLTRLLALLHMLDMEPTPPEILWPALGMSRAGLYRLRQFALTLDVRIAGGGEWRVARWGVLDRARVLRLVARR